jgi:hypothetical protein
MDWFGYFLIVVIWLCGAGAAGAFDNNNTGKHRLYALIWPLVMVYIVACGPLLYLRHRVKTYPERTAEQWAQVREEYAERARNAAEQALTEHKRCLNGNYDEGARFALEAAHAYQKLADLWATDGVVPETNKTLLDVPRRVVEDTPAEMRQIA